MIPYSESNSILVRCQNTEECNCRTIYIGSIFEVKKWPDCPYCQKPMAEMMDNGTWQTQAERDALNQMEYQRRAG